MTTQTKELEKARQLAQQLANSTEKEVTMHKSHKIDSDPAVIGYSLPGGAIQSKLNDKSQQGD